ncbi:hypothetical protein CWO04_12235 [Vibrio splendidus]|uniref:hypothetical protein n=1 Tax=Vibrio splendidus TaxID=29497 RepID=UPI000D3A9A10|nr:hypothetical protein [Vibrio splendidus]PTP85859.1 hypothetical protein CWO04_12235 [Vibrio splendidus]
MKSNDSYTSTDIYISTPDAIKKLFNIKLAEHKSFKDLVYPLVRSKGFFEVKKEPMALGSTKNNLLIASNSLTKLHNAVLLQGFFADSKRVKEIFSHSKKRIEAADFLETVVMGRQSILAVGIQTTALSELIVKLKSEHIDLSKEKLPKPFQELPQLSLNGVTSVMQALLAQSALLTQGESMIMHFFNQDIEKAYLAACSLGNTTPALAQYQTLIKQKYLEAVEFDDLLNNLLN